MSFVHRWRIFIHAFHSWIKFKSSQTKLAKSKHFWLRPEIWTICFWRIYLGVKTSYVFSSKNIFESSSINETSKDLPFNKFQSGFTLNAGNNTWNIGIYYGFRPMFKTEFADKNVSIKNTKQFKVGLIFYIF